MNDLLKNAAAGALLRAAQLELASPVKNCGVEGRRLGRGHGNALEFSDYREYRGGDDLRRLDWRVYAQSEQLVVKVFSEEVDPRCDIMLDESGSLGAVPGVAPAALGIAALLTAAAGNAGFSLAVWHSREQLIREPRPYSPLEWSCGEFDAAASPDETISAFSGCFQARGVRIAITDLLWAGSPERFLSRFCAGAKRAVLIVPGGGAECDGDDSGNLLLADAESGEERELFIDPGCRRRYRERLARHRELWERSAAEYGASLLRPCCDGAPETWDLGIFFQAGLLK